MDDFEIPDFLRRTRENDAEYRAARIATPVTASPPIAPASSWERIEKRRKAKARGRVSKMLAIKRDRDEAAAGKTWDPIKCRWH